MSETKGPPPGPGLLILFLLFIFFTAVSAVSAQTAFKDRISATVFADAAVPVLGDGELFGLGFGGAASLDVTVLPFLHPFVHGGFHLMPVHGGDPLSLFDAGLGAGFRIRPTERINLRVGALGGLYLAQWLDYGFSGVFFGVRAQAGYRLSPSVTLSLHGGFYDYLSSPSPFLRMISAGVSVHLQFSEMGNKNANIEIQRKRIDPIFPVFYSYYDENTFGTMEVTNREENEVEEVSVSLLIPEYMSQPRQCSYSETLAPGESVEIPLFALLNDEVLELTENTRTQALISVEYRVLGRKRKTAVPIEFTLYHRNAMTWDDDRKAAAFVSPTDPAVLWFSRFASGIVRDRRRGNINTNLQQAMGIFEALRMYGINYVIDPNSSYVELSEQEHTIDYLQYPHQTLFFRGGDCDDLSILYASLLESVGIRTAFITIPGHIYMAFALDESEGEAREKYYDPSMLIFIDGETWVPVEVTLVNEGFLKAWRIGAKEWADNVKTDSAVLYPLRECWSRYRPVGIPGVNPRFALPDEVETIRTFDAGMNRYVAREIDAQKTVLEMRSDGEEKKCNDLGILYGRYGMLDEAWKEFSEAAKKDYPFAWTNLGNIAFLQKNYELAVSYYSWALKLNPDDSIALLGVARSYYELERLEESDRAYAVLVEADPGLAAEYGYLASVFGGEGRAWTFSQRLATTAWTREKEPEAVHSPEPAEPANMAEEPTAPEAVVRAEDTTGAAEGVRIALEEVVPLVSSLNVPRAAEALETREAVAESEQALPPPEEEPDIEPPVEIGVPPEIAESLPEDLELEEKEAEIAFSIEEADRDARTELEVPETGEEPPAITESLPEDLELKEKEETIATREREAVREPEPEPEPKPAPVPEPEPPPEPKPEPEPEHEPQPAPEPPIAADEPPAPVFAEDPLNGLRSVRIIDSFKGAVPALGSWTLRGESAEQTDREQLFAKLAVPVRQDSLVTKYSFSARSTGRGWTGLGIHIYRDDAVTHTGYGAGNSLLIWITRDPVHYEDTHTRLEIYRSYSDTFMSRVHGDIIPESIVEENFYEIVYDRIGNYLTVRINGSERLRLTDNIGLGEGRYVVFRTLDTSGFANFSMEVLTWNGHD